MHKHIRLGRAVVAAGFGLACLAAAQAASVDKFLEDAKAYQNKGEHRAAIIQLKNALQQEGGNREARFLIAQSYLKLGDGASAEKELKRARELGAAPQQVLPSLGQAYLLQRKFKQVLDELKPDANAPAPLQAELLAVQGTAHMALGEYAPASEKFNAALKLDANTQEAWLGRARVALLQQNRAEAVQRVDELVKKLPKLADAWLLKGELHRSNGEVQPAIDAYQQALTLEPDNMSAHLGRAMMLIAQQKYPEAEQDVTAVMQILPKHPIALYLKGLSAFQQNKLPAAKDLLQQAATVAPNHMPTYLLLGAIQYREGELESAAESLKRFIAAAPEHVPSRKLYAAVQLKLKQPDRAVETLDVIAKQAAEDPQLLALLGSAYMQKGDLSKGVEYLEHAAKIAPDAAAIRTQLALGYLASGESANAVSELESAVDLGQGLVQADMLLVFTHLQSREFDEAIKAAKALAKKKPNNPVPVNMIGVAYLGKQDTAAARKQFDQALKLDPAFTPAHMNLAKIEEAAGKPDEASRHYQAILAKDEKHVGAMLSLARLAEQQGKSDKALSWLEQARSKAPDSIEPGLVLVQYHLQHGDAPKALNAARDLSNMYPDHLAVIETLGKAQMANNEANNAVVNFRKLVTKHPKAPQSHYLLASAQALAGDSKGAAASLNKALEVQPDFLPALVALAAMKMEAGQQKEALEAAKRIQKYHPDAGTGYEVEGNVYVKDGKFAEAAKAYETAYAKGPAGSLAVKIYQARRGLGAPDATEALTRWLKANPDDAGVAMTLAMVYQSDNRAKDAIPHYERVLQKFPDNVVALNNLAWIYQEQGDKRAVDYAERAYRLKPEDGRIADTLGWLLVLRGGADANRGVTVLQEAALRAPQLGDIRYHLAVGLEKTGRKDDARKELERVLKGNDDFPGKDDARALLERLRAGK